MSVPGIDPTPMFLNPVAEPLPHHSGSQDRVVELLDQRLDVTGSDQGVAHRGPERKALDSLCRPLARI